MTVTTLREKLDEALPCEGVADGEPCPADLDVFRDAWCTNCQARRLIESWAYGDEAECPECINGWKRFDPVGGNDIKCPSCHGTGKTRGPGLVARVRRSAEASCGSPFIAPADILYALHQELGEAGA